jgi:Recombination endonuclease VII
MLRKGTQVFIGKPCPRGHTLRYKSGGRPCVTCSNAVVAKYQAKNRDKMRARNAAWRRDNPEKARAKTARRVMQNRARRGAVPPRPHLCERPSCTRTATCLDHDHATGRTRGWVCKSCNLALGLLGDDIAGARSLVSYLERSTSSHK